MSDTPTPTITVRNATKEPGRDILVAGRPKWGAISFAGSPVKHVTLYPGQTALVERTPDPLPDGLEVVAPATRSKRGK